MIFVKKIIHTKNAINYLQKHYSHYHLKTTKKNNDKLFFYYSDIIKNVKKTKILLHNVYNYKILNVQQRFQLRRFLLSIAENIDQITNLNINKNEKIFLYKIRTEILTTVEYAPIWIILIIAFALSIGTMFGWKRIVVTIGEKIGKKRMTYAQAMSAQITSSFSIGIASYTGIPVSTTHILSSSVAGAMLADGDQIQTNTIKNIIIAWILTLPISIFLSSFLYWIALFLIE